MAKHPKYFIDAAVAVLLGLSVEDITEMSVDSFVSRALARGFDLDIVCGPTRPGLGRITIRLADESAELG